MWQSERAPNHRDLTRVGRARTVVALGCLCAALGTASLGTAGADSTPAQGPGGAAPASGQVRLFPEAPVQGDTIVVMISTPPGVAAAATFDGNPIGTFQDGTERRALIGTDPDVAAGAHRIDLVLRGANGTVHRMTRTIRLAAAHFGVRRLVLPPSTFGLITTQNLETERRALGPVLSRRTPVAWWHGVFALPSDGPIDSPYGEQGWYNGHREWWHMGVDFAAPAGAPVTSANAGIVALARALPLGGNTVVVDHGQGVLSEYLHLSAFAVAEGGRVDRGAILGRIGATGLVTGPGLHWGLYVNGVPVNPLYWTRARAELTATGYR